MRIKPIVTSGCMGCMKCMDVCPTEACNVLSICTIDYEKCVGCGTCIDACPVEAIEKEIV